MIEKIFEDKLKQLLETQDKIERINKIAIKALTLIADDYTQGDDVTYPAIAEKALSEIGKILFNLKGN
jgi:hypothetical protein